MGSVDVSRVLRRLRRARDMTQGALAAAGGIRQQELSAIERGLRPPRALVDRLAAALGLSGEALIAHAKGAAMVLPELEYVAAAVHDSWVARKRAEGVTSRPHPQTGDEQIAPWAGVSEVVKEENRALVRTVYAAIAALEAADRACPEPPEMKRSYPPRTPRTPEA
jgi:transcriptional regulator with XRE-family HTH domain